MQTKQSTGGNRILHYRQYKLRRGSRCFGHPINDERINILHLIKNILTTSFKRTSTEVRLGLCLLIMFLGTPAARASGTSSRPVEIDTMLTLKQIARRNQVPAEKLLKYLDLSPQQGSIRPMQADCSVRQIENAIVNIRSLGANRASNNWFFALAKFAKWALKLIAKVFIE